MRAAESSTKSSIFVRLRPGAPDREVAWEEFAKRYEPIIRAFARRMGATAEEAEETAQEVLIGFFAVAPEFVYDAEKGSFRGYLKTCAWRKLERQLQKRMRTGEAAELAESREKGVEAAWEEAWSGSHVQRAMEIVRKRYMARNDGVKTFRAFELYVMLERPAEEVAREIGISVASVHAARTRVTRAIRETVEDIEMMCG